MFFGFRERLRILSISANTCDKSTPPCSAGPMTAASSPRLVIPIRSPRAAFSTNSESFCLASNNPTLRIPPLSKRYLDY